MPLCGFNQEMLEGMSKFHKGLVEQLIEKSEIGFITEKEIEEVN